MRKKTVLETVNAVLGTIYDDEGAESTGSPMHGRTEVDVDEGLRGIAPVAVTWTTDRGNWMWDGAMATLRALGVDVGAPVSEYTTWE